MSEAKEIVGADVQTLVEKMLSAGIEIPTGVSVAIVATDAIGRLLDENAALRAEVKAHKGHATRAKREAAVLREEKSPTPRKLGRPVGRFGKPGEAYSPELAALAIEAGEELEVVFSDGRHEIVALNPLSCTAEAWRRIGAGFVLREPVLLEPGDVDIEVAGFALVSNGEQIGWRELPEPVRVPKNGRVQLDHCIIF